MQQDHKRDFLEALEKISQLDSYAISRCADGEAGVLRNETIGNKDGWLYKKDVNLVFRSDLRKSLTCCDENFVYGMSSRSVDEKNFLFLRRFIKQDVRFLTFSDIWVNANYDLFNDLFLRTLRKTGKHVILVTNPKARIAPLERSVKIKNLIAVKGNCVKFWEKDKQRFKGVLDLYASLNEKLIFLVAAGPLSNIIIFHMWNVNQNNIYLDIGSALDPIIFGRASRNYHKADHPDRRVVDEW